MSSPHLTAVVDACVLCSPLKRSLILSMAEAELFQVRWSDEIMSETEKAIDIILSKKAYDDAVDRAALARNIMNRAFDDANVINHAHHGKGIGKLPDEGDRQVIAAAVKSKADIIVTENIRDFPRRVLSKYAIEAKTSDAFIADVIDLDPHQAMAAIDRLRVRLNKRYKPLEPFLLAIETTGLKQTAKQIRALNPSS